MNLRILSAMATVLLTCSPSLSESASGPKSHEVAFRERRITPGVVAGFIGLFSPEPTGPDYELTLVTKESGPLRNVTQTIRRHREWFRVDKSDGDATSTQHVHLPTGTVVEFRRTFTDEVTYMGVRAPAQKGNGGIDYHSFRTGKFEAVLSEGCEIWVVYRGVEAGATTFTRFSCVTADGSNCPEGRPADLAGSLESPRPL